MALPDLPAREMAGAMVAACRRMDLERFARCRGYFNEKGVIHYWRDLIGSGEAVYREILTIWLSKVFLAADLARSVAPGRDVAWIDASVARFNRHRERDRFHGLSLPGDRLSHYGNNMTFFAAPLPLNASFLCATLPVWEAVEVEFTDAAGRAAEMPYGHDEETVLADCVWRRPELFHCIGRMRTPWWKSLLIRCMNRMTPSRRKRLLRLLRRPVG